MHLDTQSGLPLETLPIYGAVSWLDCRCDDVMDEDDLLHPKLLPVRNLRVNPRERACNGNSTCSNQLYNYNSIDYSYLAIQPPEHHLRQSIRQIFEA